MRINRIGRWAIVWWHSSLSLALNYDRFSLHSICSFYRIECVRLLFSNLLEEDPVEEKKTGRSQAETSTKSARLCAPELSDSCKLYLLVSNWRLPHSFSSPAAYQRWPFTIYLPGLNFQCNTVGSMQVHSSMINCTIFDTTLPLSWSSGRF